MKPKKLIPFMLCAMMILSSGISANAAIAGHTLYTDIIASINDYNIASFNMNGYTMVVAEDLRNYGFDVEWNETERALYIARGTTNVVNSTYIAPVVSKNMVGKKAHNILTTDIKTYINGALVGSYNINGKTIVAFDDLAIFGKVTWNDIFRRLDLDVTDGLEYKISPPCGYDAMILDGIGFSKDSFDNLTVYWKAKNNSHKTIKYITPTFYMFNSVGDFVYDKYTNEPYFDIKLIGPSMPGEYFTLYYGEDIKDSNICARFCHNILLHSIYLEYTDGTSETVFYYWSGYETLNSKSSTIY